MPVSITIPDASNFDMEVSLSGETYNFQLNYNSVVGRYSLGIGYQGVSLIRGLLMIEDTSPTFKYDLPLLSSGELLVVKFKEDENICGRDNFGNGKSYELVYVTNEEIEEAISNV
tara:strand:- start:548 stop:892 length:345 start_codon:yes stop_codon:yes gene_type:complete